MTENLEEVIGEAKDGKITKREWSNIMRDVRDREDYLSDSEHVRLVELAQRNPLALTKRQYVQCYEAALFEVTGVTRD